MLRSMQLKLIKLQFEVIIILMDTKRIVCIFTFLFVKMIFLDLAFT